MRFTFIENDNDLRESFSNYFKFLFNKNLFFSEDCLQNDLNIGDQIFIMDPIEVNGEFFSIFTLWVEYVKEGKLPLRLIILNYEKIENLSSNPFFINLIDSDCLLSDKIEIVLSVDDLSVYDYVANFQATNIVDVLKVFFKGHGQESLIKILTDLDQYFQQGPQLVAMDDYTVEECVQELIVKRAIPKWESFKERYDKYLLYFRYTPFFKEIQGLTDYFRKVDAYLQNIPKTKEAFIQARISEEIRKARVILEDIDRKYIGSERPIQL
jgi:hypothetical protein